MKNLMKRVIAILFLLLLIINNSLLSVISMAVDELQGFTDKSKIDAIMEISLEKYVNYALSDETKGVMVQANLKTGIKYENSQDYKPLLATSVDLNLPKVNDEYPKEVQIIGLSTKATNGSDIARDFEYQYDKNSGILKIVTINSDDENGNIYSDNIENSRDEFTLISYYSENCYTDRKDDRDLKFNGVIKVDLENNEELNLVNEFEQNFTVNENIYDLISAKIYTSEVYDGFINSNKLKNTQYTTEYVQSLKLDIGYVELADEINLNLNNSFLNNDKVVDTNEIVYKSTKINKQDVLDKLGEEGYLKILNVNGEVLVEINKDTETLDDGIIEFNYEGDISNLVINLSKPINLGTLDIQNIMQIKDTMKDTENSKILTTCNIEGIDNFDDLDRELVAVVDNDQDKIYTFSSDNLIEIKNAETRVDLSIDKDVLTNNIQNDVMFKAFLFENDSRYCLFKDPVIDIELPTEVDNVILGDISLLYGNGLKLGNAEVIANGENKVIRLSLIGDSSDYVLNSMVNGAELLIPATIIVKKDVLSTDSSIKYTYVNNVNATNDYINEEKQFKDIGIHIDSIMQNLKNENTNNLLGISEENNKEEFVTEVVAKVGNTVLKENDIVYQGESINYTVKFKNNSSQTIYNLNTVCDIPEGTTFVIRNELYSDVEIEGEEGNEINEIWDKKEDIREYNISLGELKPGDSFEQSYQVLVEETVGQKELISKFKTSIQGNVVKEDSLKVVANSAELCANLYPQNPERGVYKNNDTHQLNIVNLSDRDIENVVVDVYVSKEITVNLNGLMGKFDEQVYDEDKGILTLKYNKIEAGATKYISVNTIVDKFENGSYRYDPILYAKVYTNSDIQYRSPLNIIEIERPKISIAQTSEKESNKLLTDEEIEYNFVVKNESNVATYINIEDNLPNGIVPIEAEYEYFELDTENNQWNKKVNKKDISEKITIDGVVQSDFKLITYIPENEILNIKIKAKADAIFKSLDVVNVATVSGSDIFTITSNGIKNTVLYLGYQEEPEEPDKPVDPEEPDKPVDPEEPEDPDKPIDPEDPDNPSIEENKYSINGVVWLDSDKDGKRSSDERLLSNIEVKLFDMKTNKIVVDSNNNSMITYTNNDGYYSFDDVKQGKYIVLFQFNTDKYSLTTYQKSNISESVNSDVILKEVSIDGKTHKVGVTDTIDLVKNYSNIDMGLVENDEFDLRLDKYISKITVNYNGQSKNYDYNNAKLAKVEVPSKQLASSVINVEYKIVVTNEGNTAGYVKEIVDYIPSDLSFNAIYNNGWKKDSSGNLINDSLAGNKLEPGESTEVILILTAKNITKSIVNAAEISKTYNENELKDIDSIERNGDIKEDDYSTAEMIISIKTGILLSIFKIILIIAIVVGFVFAIYYFRNANVRKTLFMSILLLGVIASGFISIATGESRVIYWSELGHHLNYGVWEAVNSGGRYWCISESAHLCNQPHLYYLNDEYECWSEELPHGLSLSYIQSVFPGFAFGTTGNTEKNINMTKTKSPDKYGYVGEKILVGPFEFSADVSDEYISSYKIYNENGRDITSETLICNENGNSKSIARSQEFYLAVPIDTENVKLTIKMKYEDESEKNGLHFKTWYFNPNAGAGYCDGNANGFAQSLLEIDTKTKKEKRTAEDELTWTVPTPSPRIPKGSIKIDKVNHDGKSVSGAKFIVYYNEGGTTKYISKYNESIKSCFGFSNSKSEAYEFVTNGNGEIQINNILLIDSNGHAVDNHEFTVEEVYSPNGGGADLSYQPEEEVKKTKTVTVSSNDGNPVKFKHKNIEIADLDINKCGDDNMKLSNVAFKIKYNKDGKYIKIKGQGDSIKGDFTIAKYKDIEYVSEEQATKFVSDDNGNFVVRHLPTGSYTLLEVENEHYGYNQEVGKTFDITLNLNDTAKKVADIQQLGNLDIHKIDSLAPSVELSGVEFKIGMIPDGKTGVMNYLQLKDANGHIYSGEKVGSNVTIDKNNVASGGYYHVEYVSNYNQATIFVTDENGRIFVNNLEVYFDKDTKYRYYIEEIAMGEELKMYYDVKSKEEAKDDNLLLEWNKGGKSSQKDIINKQLRIDLEGYVWEDVHSSKAGVRDNVFDKDSGDIAIENIPVTLKKNGNVIMETTTDKDGRYFFAAMGTYKGSNYTIDLYRNGGSTPGEGLLQYLVEFEFNGLKYQNVLNVNDTIDVNKDNTCKAKEVNGLRDNINERFYAIEGNGTKNGNNGETFGKTSTSPNIDLKYTGQEYTSELIQNIGYRSDSAKDYIYKNGQSRDFIYMLSDVESNIIRDRWGYLLDKVRQEQSKKRCNNNNLVEFRYI